MALRHWAFLYTAPGSPRDGQHTVVETPLCRTVLVGVPDVDAGVALGPALAASGVQLIEVCGGFGAIGTARLLAALAAAGHGGLPVGSVLYGPESVDGVHVIFAPG